MRSFLLNFMGEDEVAKIEGAYKAKNAGAEGLPVYIPKSRFDEKSAQLSAANDKIKDFEKDKAAAIKAATDPLEAKLKEIPEDWKEQIDNAKAERDTIKSDYENKLAEATKSAAKTAKLYEAGAKNVKAVGALIDDTKDIDEQITALKQSDPYLFGSKGIKKGTGKGDDNHGGEGDDGGKDPDKISTAAMYRAVGITPPTTN